MSYGCEPEVVQVGVCCTRMCGWLQSCNYLSELCSMQQCSTYTKLFVRGMSHFGIPSRTRSDAGLENDLVCRLMICLQGMDRQSHIVGRSVHNQRIERL